MLSAPANNWAANTTISYPGSEQFVNATERWTIYSAPTYSAAISPGTEEDARKVVKLAVKSNVSFLATGGRHGYTTTLGRMQDGLAIDMSKFKSVVVNKAAKTLTIGAGVRTGEVIEPLWAAGLQLPTGSASCPGLVGVTLGGGVGRFMGIFGLVLDSLVSVRLITAGGQLITVSRTENANLFWGLRGAGANFGVVTSATFKVYPLINGGNLLSAEMVFPASQSAAYFNLVESYNGRLPKELAGITIVSWDAASNSTVVQVNWVYAGPEAAGRAAMAPFIALNPPILYVNVVPWNLLIATAGGGGVDKAVCQDNIPRDLYSLNLRRFHAPTYISSFAKMDAFFQQNPGGRSSILQFEFFPNQAVIAVPANDTAYPWRDTVGYMNPNMLWTPGDEPAQRAAQAVGQELRRDLAATSAYPELTVFLNYARGDETKEQIYSKCKLPRLAALKKKWDPTNAFGFNNPVPMRYP
ncbi:hypothetical protein B0T17DRAFT_609009 [Bombardia bombarda]|uniref:FAD-binding PCMH-type domain-containing protein n=1 Tax=Bombardia bombarda TaxID=252184 RepID=A0AA39WUY9_9PEZI|nr:hypothetical protein B0T17DRAFT_609009 [Bombardia bombarda]